MPPHSRQHFVAQAYLKAWADPACPAGHDPYVWQFAKDGQTSRKRAPSNLFHETDIYTIQRDDGSRDLTLERVLSGLEDRFCRICRDLLERHRTLTEDERFALCLFVAVSRARTPSTREHVRREWTPLLDVGKRLRERAARGVRMPPALGQGPSMSEREIEDFVDHPLPSTISAAVQVEASLLMGLDMVVLDTDDSPGFITSDHPCVWFDDDACRRPPQFQHVGLGSRTIEVSLPVSPRQCILLHRGGTSGYEGAPREAVDEINRRTRFRCNEYFVVNCDTTRPIWFDPGEEPPDSWRRRIGGGDVPSRPDDPEPDAARVP